MLRNTAEQLSEATVMKKIVFTFPGCITPPKISNVTAARVTDRAAEHESNKCCCYVFFSLLNVFIRSKCLLSVSLTAAMHLLELADG